jgi:hypothetical protein
MPKFRVKLIFKYSDVIHVEAKDEKDAIEKAFGECNEQFECFEDAEITKECFDDED